jgi:hypothetical protein
MEKLHKSKYIWLNTNNSTIANGGTDEVRRFFRFNNLPLIQIKKKSVLRVNSLTLSGAGHQEATGHNWEVKICNINYNQASYYNSDNFAEPTIAQFNFDSKNTIQNGFFKLELEPQDIQNIIIEVYNEAGEGLFKNLKIIDIHLGLIIEEIEDY